MSNTKLFIVAAAILIIAGAVAAVSFGLGGSELDEVRAATEGYQSVAAAEAAGFVNVNIEECVASPEGAMGYHYVNFDLLDLELDPQQPEIMVFIPDAGQGLRLGAVEYAVPIEPWDAMYDSPPEVLGQVLHPNPVLGLYVLHVWLYEENPSGIFADWNPNVSCSI